MDVTRVVGSTIRLVAKANLSTQRGTSTRDHGSTTKRTGSAYIPLLTAHGTRAIGETTTNTVRVSKSLSEEPSMRVITPWATKMASVNTHTSMGPIMRVNGRITEYRGMANNFGKMARSSMDSGIRIKCMDLAFTSTLMGFAMMANSWQTSKKASGFTHGQMAESIEVGGSKTNSMAMGPISAVAKNSSSVSGTWVRGSSGSLIQKSNK